MSGPLNRRRFLTVSGATAAVAAAGIEGILAARPRYSTMFSLRMR